MADRALENNTLALRNSPRRDLLREGMDRLKCPLEVRSLLHIRMLELASVSAVPVSISYARSTGKNYLTGEGQETLALLDRGSETTPLPSHSTTETKGISDSGTKNGLCFNLALRVPNVMTHCPVGPLDPFPGNNPASPHPALPPERRAEQPISFIWCTGTWLWRLRANQDLTSVLQQNQGQSTGLLLFTIYWRK